MIFNNFSGEGQIERCRFCIRKREKVRDTSNKFTVCGKGDGSGVCMRDRGRERERGRGLCDGRNHGEWS